MLRTRLSRRILLGSSLVALLLLMIGTAWTSPQPMTVKVTIDNGFDDPTSYKVATFEGEYISDVLATVSRENELPIIIGVNPKWKDIVFGQQVLQIGGWRNADIAENPQFPSVADPNAWWSILIGPSLQRSHGHNAELASSKLIDPRYLLLGPTASASTSQLYPVPIEKSKKYKCAPQLYFRYNTPYPKRRHRR